MKINRAVKKSGHFRDQIFKLLLSLIYDVGLTFLQAFVYKNLLWVKHQNDAVLIWRAKLATSAALFGRLMEGHLATIKAASLCPTPLDCSFTAPLCQTPLRFVILAFLLIVLCD